MTGADFERVSVGLGDSRSVEVGTAGPATGLPLVFHCGTPAGLAYYEPLVRAAADAGLRMVQYSRPGYGDSEPHPGRRVADAAADVADILDYLGADKFVTAGWSGGGPHALACAALLPDRCLAAATIAGIAPRDGADRRLRRVHDRGDEGGIQDRDRRMARRRSRVRRGLGIRRSRHRDHRPCLDRGP